MNLINRVIRSGSAASLLSAGVVALRSKADTGSAFQGVNDTSHWLWGPRAFQQSRPSLRHTVPGFAIHYLSGIFWGFLFEKLLDRKLARSQAWNVPVSSDENSLSAPQTILNPQNICRTAAVVAAIANVVDFKLTPQRLTPGFEHHLSRRSLAVVYVSFGAGLAAAAYLRQRKIHRDR